MHAACMAMGSKTVTARTFSIERQENGSWQQLGEASAADLEIVTRGYTRYTVDLTKIIGAQQPGSYRVKAELKADGEALPLELETPLTKTQVRSAIPFCQK